eukprot:6173543-Pleurochrysis_carterae.AAC.1
MKDKKNKKLLSKREGSKEGKLPLKKRGKRRLLRTTSGQNKGKEGSKRAERTERRRKQGST